MRPWSVSKVALHLVLFFISVSFSHQATAEDRPARITVVLPYDLPPFVMRGPEGHLEGARVDAWTMWSGQTGIAVDLVPQTDTMFQAPNAIPQNVVFDMYLHGINPDPDLALSDPYTSLDLVLYHDGQTSGLAALDAPMAADVGTVADGPCDHYLSAIAHARINRFSTTTNMLFAAITGRLQAFCIIRDRQTQYMGELPFFDRFHAADINIALPVGWAVPRQNKALFDLVSAGFAAIPTSELRAIEDNWRTLDLHDSGWYSATLLSSLVILLMGFGAVTLFLRWKLGKERAAQTKAQHILQASLHRQACLARVDQVTQNMMRPLSDILTDIATELRQVWPDATQVSVRITLLGVTHEQPEPCGRVDTASVPILMKGTEQGRITLKKTVTRNDPRGTAFSRDDIAMLELISARITRCASKSDSLIHLQSSAERFFLALMTSDRPAAIVSDNRFSHINAAAAALLGYARASDLIGRSPVDISPRAQPDGQSSGQRMSALFSQTIERGNLAFEWTYLHAEGIPVVTEVLMTTMMEKDPADFFIIWTDITERRRVETELANTRQYLADRVEERTAQLQVLYDQLNTILTTADSGIALICDGVIAKFNPALARLFCWPPDQVEGASTARILRDAEMLVTLRNQAFRAFSQGLTYETELECLRRDGTAFWARMRARAIDCNNPAAGAVWVIDDITKERDAAEKLAQGRDLAEQAALLKSRFLAEISHEIRAPINAVLGFTDMLMHTEMSIPQRDYMQKVQTAGHHLLGIINNVLDLSKVETGHLQLEETKFELAPILRCAVDAILPRTAARDVEIILKADPALPKSFVGDPLRITQILMNFLTNAEKFTPTGEIGLTVESEGMAAGRMLLKFSVSDTGIGMSPDQAGRIFDAFAQADASTTRLYGGSGLGLSICRQLAELMGGQVGVDSITGKGSTFWFRIALPAKAGRTPVPVSWRRLRNRRILIVDDNATAAGFLEERLRGLGMQVVTVSSGHACMAAVLQAQAEGRPFDVVLIDRKMPTLNGIETARALRRAEGHGRLPLLLMSKTGGTDLTDMGANVGIDEILAKPIDIALLAEKLCKLLENKPLASPQRPAEIPEAKLWTDRRALVVDDGPLSLEITAALLIRQGFSVQTATNGQDALRLITEQVFDVILMDFQMPDMDGLETTRRICATAAMVGRVPPIIGLSGRVQDSERKAGLDAGMIDYICKPVTASALSAVLARIVAPDTVPAIH
jgi:two-component system, sensor histidine kinase and response regulator